MQGVLFRYGPSPAQIAFRSTPTAGGSGGGVGGAQTAAAAAPPRQHLVLVAGLTEGLLALPYAERLAEAAEKAGFSLVQAQLTSSYQGWGVGSLDADADDLLLLTKHLKRELGSQGVVLMGHSTGCQDAVRYCRRHAGAEGAAPLKGVVLQAPVSDREWLASAHPALLERLPDAQRLTSDGRGDDIICRAPADLGGAPLSAARLVALGERLGDDDMWSGDLTSDELRGILGHMGAWPLLVLLSGADECVPDQGAIPLLGQRIMLATKASGACLVLDGAPHNAAGHEAALAGHVGSFLETFGKRNGGGGGV